jgi:predicted nucleic acid-binding protein
VSEPDSQQRAAFLDAVCCIQFHSAGKTGMLLKILLTLRWEIHVPFEVDAEVRRGQHKTALAQWNRFTASDHVTVLNELTTSPTSDEAVMRVRRLFAQVRGTSLALAVATTKHRGEAAVIAYAREYQDSGRPVVVLIDDDAAATQAQVEYQLTVISMEDLLLLGHQIGVAELDTKAKVRQVYEKLEPFGGSLVSWEKCGLRGRL